MEHPVKNAISTIFVFIIFLVMSSFKNQKEDPDLRKFKKYFMRSYQLPQSIVQDCNWNYAIVVLRTDAGNKVINVEIANNEVSTEFEHSFQFLKGYQFSKDLQINRRPIVFILTVEQLGGMGCDTPNRDYSPSTIANRVLLNIGELLKKEPSSIVKYNPIVQVAGGRVN